ncbi:unnamed protein product [Brassicogethes aeneus]|uniref:DNA helicase n=1 Tax=Brassicogethes aeneus TaxID=1431903 RepID=A0A9P0AX44_BRAAE|nr:unnamed protein product [Brassicogethes aeneus]
MAFLTFKNYTEDRLMLSEILPPPPAVPTDFDRNFTLILDLDEPAFGPPEAEAAEAKGSQSSAAAAAAAAAAQGDEGAEQVEQVVSLRTRIINDCATYSSIAQDAFNLGGLTVKQEEYKNRALYSEFAKIFAPAVGFICRSLPITKIEDLRAAHIGKLTRISGKIMYIGPHETEAKVITTMCELCGAIYSKKVMTNSCRYFMACVDARCSYKPMEVKSRYSRFERVITFKMRPTTNVACLTNVTMRMNKNSFVGNLNEEVEVYGTFLTRDTKVNGKYTYEAYHMERVKRIPDLALPNYNINMLVASLAPHVFGNKLRKLAILLQAVGGNAVYGAAGLVCRGNINIMFEDEVASGKSSLLVTASELFENENSYVNGPLTTIAGLLGCSGPDGSIYPGTLWTNGTVAVDDCHNMREEVLTGLLEPMESNRVSLNKASLCLNRKTTVSILAASRGNFRERRGEAFSSRFDLIMKEEMPSDYAKLAVRRHYGEQATPPLTMDELRAAIRECREVQPIMQPDVNELISEWYVKLKKKHPSFNPRALVSVCRLATALARLRRSILVHYVDADKAIKLFDSCL